ncbi:MAG: helix-turn-helix domain-containing protein [Candidatus Kerfeldbacteria bacterium]|nr:helix-turn-helix domain-containing protein [Candidatus Kerfeldbacteria bacterium]
MRKDKARAIDLRKQGKSYNEISAALHIPKSTLSNWFACVQWSQMTKQHLSIIHRERSRKRMKALTDDIREKRNAAYAKRRNEAKKMYPQYQQDRLFIAGLMLYWGEGDRKLQNGCIRLANSDPDMLLIFHRFLKKYLPTIYKKTKAYLILYPDLEDKAIKTFWSRHIGVSLDKFYKTHYIKGRHASKRLPYGVCTIIIRSREYKEMIDEWLQLAKSDFV